MGFHDQLFKELLEWFLGDVLRLVVPRIARRLAPERRRLLPNEGFTDSPRGEQRLVDLVAEVPVEGPRSADEPESLAVHVEVERQARSGMGYRMLEYSRMLALSHQKPVLSIVLYLSGGPGGVAHRKLTEGLAGAPCHVFHYHEVGLSPSPATRYLETDLPLAWAMAALTRRPPSWSRARHKYECLKRIARAEEIDPAARELLTYCVGTYLDLDETETEELRMLAERNHRQDILDILDSGLTWRERVRVEAVREILLRQLGRKFEFLPTGFEERLKSINSEARLEEIADRLLTADSLADLGLA